MIYLTGDIHGDLLGRISKKSCLRNHNPLLVVGDILIVLGDFGHVWSNESWNTIHYLDKYLVERGIKVLSVIGNHENMNMIEQLPQVNLYGGLAYEVTSNIHFLKHGSLFEIEGQKFAVFGGALSIDKYRRVENKSWWSQEIPSKEIMQSFVDNLDSVNTEEYNLLTHTTNYEQIKLILWNDSPKLDDVARFLEFIKFQYNFKHHYFGHFHENRFYKENTLLFDKIIRLNT